MGKKVCTKCGMEKDNSEFYDERRRCKDCIRKKMRQRTLDHSDHPERIMFLRSRGECPPEHKWCCGCKAYLPLDQFHPKMRKGQCRKCASRYDVLRSMKFKMMAIEYLGGKCAKCGWNGHWAAFDFHHRDPTEKEVSWDRLRKRSWDRMRPELDKCTLLCRNCHTILHCSLDEDGNPNPEFYSSVKTAS